MYTVECDGKAKGWSAIEDGYAFFRKIPYGLDMKDGCILDMSSRKAGRHD